MLVPPFPPPTDMLMPSAVDVFDTGCVVLLSPPPSPMDTPTPASEVEVFVSAAFVEVLGTGITFVVAILVGTMLLGGELAGRDVSTILIEGVGDCTTEDFDSVEVDSMRLVGFWDDGLLLAIVVGFFSELLLIFGVVAIVMSIDGVEVMIGFDVEDNKPTVTVYGHAGKTWPTAERVAVQPEITLEFIASVDALEAEVAVVGLLPVDDFSRTDVDDC